MLSAGHLYHDLKCCKKTVGAGDICLEGCFDLHVKVRLYSLQRAISFQHEVITSLTLTSCETIDGFLLSMLQLWH